MRTHLFVCVTHNFPRISITEIMCQYRLSSESGNKIFPYVGSIGMKNLIIKKGGRINEVKSIVGIRVVNKNHYIKYDTAISFFVDMIERVNVCYFVIFAVSSLDTITHLGKN